MQQKALITGWRGKKSRQVDEREARGADRGDKRGDKRDRPKKRDGDASRRETRIVRDDDGRFFMNASPKAG